MSPEKLSRIIQRVNRLKLLYSSVGMTDHVLINQSDLVAPKNGYVFVYCSNESAYDVYFDNIQVFHNKSALVEETHYYPFGLAMPVISTKAATAAPENKHKYNGIEQTTELGLNQFDAQLRELDPQIGRWWEIDPKIENMEMWSPYVSNYDNPIRYSDPLGDEGQNCCKDVIDVVSWVGDKLNQAGNSAPIVWINNNINPLTPLTELVSGKSLNSGYTEGKSRLVSGVELAAFAAPGVKAESVIAKEATTVVTSAVEKSVVSLDNNALIKAVEGGGKEAVKKAIGNDVPIVSITAAKEFLVKGEKQQLKSFMTEIGATISKKGASAAQVKQLQAKAISLGRKLAINDASIVGGAINNNASILTNDKRLINFLQAFGVPFKTH